MVARFDAVVFDLDGTLLDTLADIGSAVNAVLSACGAEPHPIPAYKAFVGEGVGVLVRRAFPEALIRGEDYERRLAQVRDQYRLCRDENSAPYPGIPELLDGLGARGLPLAILSNKPHPFTVRAVKARLGRWRFAAVQGAAPELPLKPDPAGAIALARELGVTPERALYLGDTGIDMRTATAAGMHAVGALWGFRGAEELQAAGARRLIGNPVDLLSLL